MCDVGTPESSPSSINTTAMLCQVGCGTERWQRLSKERRAVSAWKQTHSLHTSPFPAFNTFACCHPNCPCGPHLQQPARRDRANDLFCPRPISSLFVLPSPCKFFIGDTESVESKEDLATETQNGTLEDGCNTWCVGWRFTG